MDDFVSQRRKLSLREMKSLAQGHRGDKGQNRVRIRSAELQAYAAMRAGLQTDSPNCVEKTSTAKS